MSSQSSTKSRLAAWSVHVFTMSGVIWACLATVALIEHQFRLMWLWLGIALIVDAIDGTLARAVKVTTHAPHFDGSTLDMIVDYLTWTFIPAIFMFLHVPLGRDGLPLAMLILATTSSIFCYCNTQLKTHDYYFQGFPAAWNMVVLVMWLFHTPAWLNIAITIIFAILTVLPIMIVHPLRVEKLRKYNIFASIIGIGAAVWLVYEYPHRGAPQIIILVLATAWIVGVSALRTWRGATPIKKYSRA